MKKNYLLIVTAFACLIGNVNAQSPNWLWAKAMSGTGNEHGNSVAVDVVGNVYTTGYFEGTVDFDPSAGVFNLTSNGSQDVFISKLDASGNFVWAKATGGASDEEALFITVDVAGNVHVIGYYESLSANFNADTLTNLGGSDIFIAKLDIATGIESLENYIGVTVYPNPATDKITIALLNNNKEVVVTISDITGKIIYRTIAAAIQKIEVNTKDFAEGIYVLQIQAADFIETKRLIVTE